MGSMQVSKVRASVQHMSSEGVVDEWVKVLALRSSKGRRDVYGAGATSIMEGATVM